MRKHQLLTMLTLASASLASELPMNSERFLKKSGSHLIASRWKCKLLGLIGLNWIIWAKLDTFEIFLLFLEKQKCQGQCQIFIYSTFPAAQVVSTGIRKKNIKQLDQQSHNAKKQQKSNKKKTFATTCTRSKIIKVSLQKWFKSSRVCTGLVLGCRLFQSHSKASVSTNVLVKFFDFRLDTQRNLSM